MWVHFVAFYFVKFKWNLVIFEECVSCVGTYVYICVCVCMSKFTRGVFFMTVSLLVHLVVIKLTLGKGEWKLLQGPDDDPFSIRGTIYSKKGSP